jgi:hypothetical protein
VADGGLLVLTSSAHRLKLVNRMYDYNEDWRDVNALARRFGISYDFETLPYRLILVEEGSHPLVEGVSYLEMLQKNGVSLTMSEGHVLAQEDGKVMAGLVDYGDGGGQVLALADVGILGNASSTPSRNLTFWQNLARYARSRQTARIRQPNTGRHSSWRLQPPDFVLNLLTSLETCGIIRLVLALSRFEC